MISKIIKTTTEEIKVCDICKEPASYTCTTCGNDICVAHMIIVSGYNNNVYICNQCNEKPFSEIWNKLYLYFNTTINIYPAIQYPYRIGTGTGDYWPSNITFIPTGRIYTKE